MRPTPPRRKSRDYLVPFLIVLAIGVIAALLLQLWGLWGDTGENTLTLSGKAELTDVSGDVEVYLPATGSWKITSEAAVLNPGESVRTGTDGSATLTFDDGSVATLANSSELAISDLQNSITKKSVTLALARGATAITVGTKSSDLVITSEFLRIHNADGRFLMQVNTAGDLASAIEGGFVAAIIDPENTTKTPELKNLMVESGKTVEISERRINLLRIGGEIDLVQTTPAEILNSNLYLAATSGTNLVSDTVTNPDTVVNPDGTVSPATTPDGTVDSATNPDSERIPAPLVVTGGGNVSAVAEPVKVVGKVSPKVVKIKVTFDGTDAFELSKFVPGSGEWSYNAARSFENLKVGVNNYSVVGYDEAGNATPTASFQIRFNPDGATSTTTESTETSTTTTTTTKTTDGVPSVGSTAFAAPTVSEPADGATFETAPVHFAGTVPVGTTAVFVNGYKLTGFVIGGTTWQYNAAPSYSNLKAGENEFEIVATNEAGERSSTTIKITYSPAETTAPETVPAGE
ncbi:MAG: FecR domain-containing protein [Patescibacteria group bacterium]